MKAMLERGSGSAAMRRGFLSHRSQRRQAGATAVEFALLAAIFMTVLISIAELSMLFFVNLTMQHAVREGTRYAVTGRSNLHQSSNQQRYEAVIQGIRNNAMGRFDQVSPVIVVTLNNDSPTSYSAPGAYSPGMFGGPGDIIVLRLDCSWPLLTPVWRSLFNGGKYAFSVAATMRNENF
jgi:Flp pilus assembly pilin Flp